MFLCWVKCVSCTWYTDVHLVLTWFCGKLTQAEPKKWYIIHEENKWVGHKKIKPFYASHVKLCCFNVSILFLPYLPVSWLHGDYKCFMSVCLKPTASIWLPLSPFIPESQWSTTGPPQARGSGAGGGSQWRRECSSWSVLQITLLIRTDIE